VKNSYLNIVTTDELSLINAGLHALLPMFKLDPNTSDQIEKLIEKINNSREVQDD
jgi:hypothetical protein